MLFPEVLRKFNPDEPRDERGRWTALGEKPPFVSTGNDEADLAAHRGLKNAWEARVTEAVATGRVSPDEAASHGWYTGNPSAWRPLPATLYHTTTAGDAVARDGLKTRAELGLRGLGGGPDNLVSFTSDAKIAQGIQNGIKEAISVAKGDITPADMVAHAVSGDNASRPYISDLANYYDRQWQIGQPLPAGLQGVLDGTHQVRDPGAFMTYSYQPLDEAGRIDQNFDFYKNYSAFREAAGGAYDPLFFGVDAKDLAGVNPGQVRTFQFTPTPGAYGEYASGMSEYRTSPHAVRMVGTFLKAGPPDEPREPSGSPGGGQWTAGGSGEGASGSLAGKLNAARYIPGVTNASIVAPGDEHKAQQAFLVRQQLLKEPGAPDLASAIATWQATSGDAEMIRASAAGATHLGSLPITEADLPEEDVAAAKVLAAAVANGAPQPELWRGMSDLDQAASAKFVPGQMVHMGLCSFSRDTGPARFFIDPGVGTGNTALMHVAPGAAGLFIAPLGGVVRTEPGQPGEMNSVYYAEQEVIAGGTFEVVSVSSGDVPPVVELRQVRRYEALTKATVTELPFDWCRSFAEMRARVRKAGPPDELRDERGRWTVGGVQMKTEWSGTKDNPTLYMTDARRRQGGIYSEARFLLDRSRKEAKVEWVTVDPGMRHHGIAEVMMRAFHQKHPNYIVVHGNYISAGGRALGVGMASKFPGWNRDLKKAQAVAAAQQAVKDHLAQVLGLRRKTKPRRPPDTAVQGEVLIDLSGVTSEVGKAGPADEPRDERGRWTSGGGADTAAEDWARKVGAFTDQHRPPGWAYGSVESLVAANGRNYTPAALPKDVPRGPMKFCFKNAFSVLLAHPELTYVEGLASTGILPVHHAWLATADGHVVDPTWSDGTSYFGVALATDYVMKTAVETGHYGVFGALGAGRVLLEKGLPPDARATGLAKVAGGPQWQEEERDDHGKWWAGGGSAAPVQGKEVAGSAGKEALGKLFTQSLPGDASWGRPSVTSDVTRSAAKAEVNQHLTDAMMARLPKDPALQQWLADEKARQVDKAYRDVLLYGGTSRFGTPPSSPGPTVLPAISVNGQLYNTAQANAWLHGVATPDQVMAWRWEADHPESKVPYPGMDRMVLATANQYLVDQWANSAGDSNPPSVAIQRAAADNFGSGEHMASLQTYAQAVNGYGDNGTRSVWDQSSIYYDQNKPLLDAYVQETYRSTQAALSGAGITSVLLWRGMDFNGPTPDWAVPFRYGGTDVTHQSATANLNPLASWSLNPEVAGRFGGMSLITVVPAARIWSYPRTGAGCLNEWEVIIADPAPRVHVTGAPRR